MSDMDQRQRAGSVRARFDVRTGEVYVFEPDARIPEECRQVPAEEADPVIREFFPGPCVYFLSPSGWYGVVYPDGSTFVEKPLLESASFEESFNGTQISSVAKGPYVIDPAFPPVRISLHFVPRCFFFTKAKEVSPSQVAPQRRRRLVSALGGGPVSRFRFLTRDNTLYIAAVQLDRGILYAEEEFCLRQNGLQRSELARLLQITPSRLTTILKRIGACGRQRGPLKPLDREVVEKVLSNIRDVAPERIEAVRKILAQAT